MTFATPMAAMRKLMRSRGLLAAVLGSMLVLASTSLMAFANEEEAKAAEGSDDASQVIIGIDLGTTYSCVAALREDQVIVLSNDQGSRITPSWVAVDADGSFLIGDAAKNQFASNPKNTVFDAKRMIGRKYDEIEKKEFKEWPFEVVNRDNFPYIKLNVKGVDKFFAPQQISAMVLNKMRETAEAALGHKVKKAVVTVPAYFKDAQRQATKDAGTIANIDVVRIINEPTAAAIAYGLDKKGETRILVFDLGGGTFDVSLLQFEDGVFEVKAVDGDTHLGGQDFDSRVIGWAKDAFLKKHNVDISTNQRALSRLRREVERAKIALSSATQVNIDLDGLANGKDFSEKLTRAKFEQLNMDFFKKTIDPVEKALKAAKWSISDVDEIVLVGGSTRIPKVQELLKEFFGGKDLNKGVNPDEAVAQGAALQAGVLMGTTRTANLLVIDVIPLSMGIETMHGVFSKIINGNSPIPSHKTQIFSTASDNQSVVNIKVYEGEREFARDNHLLGSFDLTGIPLAPRGVPQIEVTFDVNVNGILTVEAKDKGSGNTQQIKITNDKGRLSQAEIDRMKKDAEKYRDEDRKLKEKIESRDELERYVYQLKSQIADEKQMGGRISADEKSAIQDAISDSMKWLSENKEEATKEDYEEQKAKIEKIVAPIVAKLYGSQDQPKADQGGAVSDHDEL